MRASAVGLIFWAGTALALDGGVVLPPGNLLPNPSFESGFTGWGCLNSMCSRVMRPDAPHGQWVEFQDVPTRSLYATIDDSPNTLVSAGGYLTGRAWVQLVSGAEAPRLYVRSNFGGAAERIWTSAAVPVQYAEYAELHVVAGPTAPGESIDIYMGVQRPDGGLAFYWDAVSLVPSLGDGGYLSGGSDAGAVDAGAVDAGTVDGGGDVMSSPARALDVGCGCSGSSSSLLVMLGCISACWGRRASMGRQQAHAFAAPAALRRLSSRAPHSARSPAAAA